MTFRNSLTGPEMSVSAGLATRLLDFAAAAGASRAALLEQAGIGADELGDQNNRISLPRYTALMRSGSALTGRPALAIDFGLSVNMAEFSVVGLIFQTCRTVMESIHQINRYGRLVVEVDLGASDRFVLERRFDGLWLVDTRLHPNRFPELTESTFARFIGMTRPFCRGCLVEEIHVTHAAPAHATDYLRLCARPTVFDAPWNAIRLNEERLTDPVAVQPTYAFGILSEHAEALLESLDSSKSVRARVARELMPILHTGEAGIDNVAAGLGVSRQTLYRRLSAEGTTFEKVLDDLRHKLALHYIDGKRVSVDETAYLVGYSERSAFSRAFRRWTGSTIRSTRR
jgi:AraC-like DNA-binding protein